MTDDYVECSYLTPSKSVKSVIFLSIFVNSFFQSKTYCKGKFVHNLNFQHHFGAILKKKVFILNEFQHFQHSFQHMLGLSMLKDLILQYVLLFAKILLDKKICPIFPE